MAANDFTLVDVPCAHWRADGDHGQCAINAWPSPSRGACMMGCESYEGPERTEKLQRKVVGITISAIRRRWWHGWLIPWCIDFSRACCGNPDTNENAPVYRWLAVKWYGYPKILRKSDRKYRGCGCVVMFVSLKDFIISLRRRRACTT